MQIHGTDRSSTLTQLLWAAGAVLLVAASSWATAHAVLWSPFGSVLFLDEGFGVGSVIVPLVVGALVGALQTRAVGWRITFFTVLAGSVVFATTIVYLYPALMHLVGVGVGSAAVTIAGRARLVSTRSAALSLAVLTVVSGAYAWTRASAPADSVLRLVASPEHPTVVLDPQRRAPEILEPVTGVLVDVGGCLGLETEDERRFVVFWPDDTQVRADPFAVIRSGRVFVLGDELELDVAALERRPGDEVFYSDELPDACESFDVLMT